MKPNSNELAFKQKLLSAIHPGWIVSIAPENSAGKISDFETFFYVFDARTAWVGAGAINHDGFMAVRKWVVQKGREKFLSIGGNCSLAASENMATADSPLIVEALHGVGHYFAATHTCDQVFKAQGNAKGHWVCVVYTLASGNRLARPVFMAGGGQNTPKNALMSNEVLLSLVKMVIEQDVANTRSSVGSQIAKDGGGIFHASVQPGSSDPAV